ncbi:MAG TPA: glycosyltransferase family 39 protein, partial [Patescibacteria group bacterium]
MAIFLLLHVFLLTQLKFTLWPEMMVYPYLVNKGFLLFKDIVNPYPPLLTLFLALIFKVFGYEAVVGKITAWIFIIATDIAVFYFAKIIYKKLTLALVSLFFWVILSVYLEVNGLWFEQVSIPFLILGVLFLDRAFKLKNNSRLVISGIFFAIPLAIKQTAFWLFIPAVFLIFLKTQKIENVIRFLAPSVFIYLMFLIYAYSLGIQKEFVDWVFVIPLFVMGRTEGFVQTPTAGQIIRILPIILLAIPAIFSKNKQIKFVLIFFLFSLFYGVVRFELFHLLPSLAFLVLTIPASLMVVRKRSLAFMGWFFVFGLLLGLVVKFTAVDWHKETRFFEPSMLDQSRQISQRASGQKVYIQNGPDQILAIANLTPIKPWAIQFPWYLENGDLQARTIESIKKE